MKTTAIALALGLSAPLVLGGCSKKADDAPAPQATAAPAGPKCPTFSTLVGNDCKATGGARLATISWNGTLADTAQTIILRNTSGLTLKAGTVTVWFYDKNGHRLDVAGAKKYATPADVFGANVKPGETRNIRFPLSRTGVPDGTAGIEGELVKATLVNADGTDGPGWKNDDLNSDDRGMVGTPSAALAGTPPAGAGVAATAVRPGVKPAPPAPPPHR
jgi:hypothetical protein